MRWIIAWGSYRKLWNDITPVYSWLCLVRLLATPSCRRDHKILQTVRVHQLNSGRRGQQVHCGLRTVDNARRAPLVSLRRASSSALWTFARFYILITSRHKNAFPAHQPPAADLLSWQGTIREEESQRNASDRSHQQIRRRKGGLR